MQLDQWYRNLPPITRGYMTVCILTTLAVHLDFISVFDIYLNFNLVWGKTEIWRLLTNFFFFGGFGLSFFFHMSFLVRHSRVLEESSFRGKTADFLWMHLFGGSILLLLDYMFFKLKWMSLTPMFLGPSLSFMVVYVWSRRNPYMRMSFLGLFTFSAPYLPYVILGLELLMDHHGVVFDLLGIFVGHLYFFLEDIYPRLTERRVLKTPMLLKHIFVEHVEPDSDDIPDAARERPEPPPAAPVPDQQHPGN